MDTFRFLDTDIENVALQPYSASFGDVVKKAIMPHQGALAERAWEGCTYPEVDDSVTARALRFLHFAVSGGEKQVDPLYEEMNRNQESDERERPKENDQKAAYDKSGHRKPKRLSKSPDPANLCRRSISYLSRGTALKNCRHCGLAHVIQLLDLVSFPVISSGLTRTIQFNHAHSGKRN
jgi:hypothetical protein